MFKDVGKGLNLGLHKVLRGGTFTKRVGTFKIRQSRVGLRKALKAYFTEKRISPSKLAFIFFDKVLKGFRHKPSSEKADYVVKKLMSHFIAAFGLPWALHSDNVVYLYTEATLELQKLGKL